MKRQFLGRLLSLFLVGTVVAGVGCKDYDDDITSLNNRIDELTTGQIASVEKQMQSLQNAVDRLDGVDSGLKDEIEALQGKAETQAGEIGKLQEELGKAASASEVEALKKQIETLESDKGKLEKRIEALESARTSLQDEIDAVKGSLANYLTKSDAEATYATKTTVESLSQLLNQIKANYVSAEGLASTLEGYVTDAELADQLGGLCLILREIAEELFSARLRDRAEMLVRFIQRHADTVIGNGYCFFLLVYVYGYGIFFVFVSLCLTE